MESDLLKNILHRTVYFVHLFAGADKKDTQTPWIKMHP